MKKRNMGFQSQHMKERVARVKGVWVEEATKVERGKWQKAMFMRGLISFSVGYFTAYLSHNTFKGWVVTIIGYFIFYILWQLAKRVLKSWGIPDESSSK